MPAIHLEDDARQMLLSYRWPGNVRELKNITERLSVIEESRNITAAILEQYIPGAGIDKFPVVVSNKDNEQKVFNSEREILYQVLFDMKKDVNDLKKLVHDIMSGNIQMQPVNTDSHPYPAHPIQTVTNVSPMSAVAETQIQEAETVEENDTMSLEDVEKDMIKKALERHNGRRKNAAADLKISERTLYRKIKEYNLE